MITDEEIAAIEAKCRYSPDGKRFVIDKRRRDRAIYQLGRNHQRESDVAAIPSDKCLEQGDSHSDSDRKIVWNNALCECRKALEARSE